MEYLFSENAVTVITSVVTLASAVTALTPTPKDDGWWAKVYRFIEVLALVVGKAKDKGR